MKTNLRKGILGSGITARWLRGSLLITVLALIVAESLFMYSNYQSSYSQVQQSIQNRFSSIRGQLQITTGSTVAGSAQSRSMALRRMVEQFDAKDKYEFMLLDSEGNVLSTSSGQNTEGMFDGTDYQAALTQSGGVGMDVYTTAQGERVMSVTMLSPYAAEDIAALRMVTSLTLIDQTLLQYFFASIGIVAAILAFTIWSGMFFVRSIVTPLNQVERTAAQIARGDLTVRLPGTKYDDEIGRLCSTINQMAENLAETEKMKNEFISSVSHELRTPLTSIKGWVETIAGIRDPENENYRRGIVIIGSETDRLYTMVEELLDFSRMQNGMKLECHPLDLVAELTDAALFVEARILQEGLHLKYEEPELILPVYADANRLRQVFINVLDNAIKYSRPGTTITLEVRADQTDVYTFVSDQGRGIASEDLEYVKTKFFKGKNAVRGSGIGLAVVDEIISRLGGTVDITSEVGRGTTVSIRLPRYNPGEKPAIEETVNGKKTN